MGEHKPDSSDTLIALAIGYFVLGPIVMVAIIGLIALVRWII